MRSRFILGALVVALVVALGTAPASAQWTYQFSGTWNFAGTDQTLAFTLTTAAPITSGGFWAPSSCSITPGTVGSNYYLCEDPEIDPNGFGTGFAYIGARFANFDVVTNDPTGGGAAFFWFAPGTFSVPGSYTRVSDATTISAPNPLFDPNAVCPDEGDPGFDPDNPPNYELCREINLYGSAGPATLDVSFVQTPGGNGDVVPEPATLTLLATGLVGMAGARRRSGGR